MNPQNPARAIEAALVRNASRVEILPGWTERNGDGLRGQHRLEMGSNVGVERAKALFGMGVVVARERTRVRIDSKRAQGARQLSHLQVEPLGMRRTGIEQ